MSGLPFTGFIIPSGGSGGAGVSGLDTADGGTAIADNAIIRGDGATGIQGSGVLLNDSNQLVFEGTTADDFETTFGVTDPTADVTILLPNAAGTLTVGPTTTTNTGVVRWSGTVGGAVLSSGVTVDGSDVVSGITQLNADNIRLDGNTLSATNVNGNIELAPAGSGVIYSSSPFQDAGSNAAFAGLSGGIFFNNSRGIFWGSAGSFSLVTNDTGLARSAAGVVKVTNGSAGIGAILNSSLVEANTAGSGAPNVLVATESGTVLTNEGVTAENYHTLPSAVAGYKFTFVVQDADGIRITASGGDTIQPIAGTAASAAGGFIRCATLGAFITLVAINATEWVSVGSAGVWTIDA